MRPLRPRRVVGVAIVVGGAIAFSGCVSIKEERVLQPRSPGVVTLRTVVCASDHNQNHYSTCTGVAPTNVAEADNGVDADEGPAASTGQILVGYRVSDGTVAPTTFSSDVADVSFSQSPTYPQALAARYSPSAGTHWVGYIST